MPALQLEQTLAPAAEYVPERQLEQLDELDAPVVARYDPAAHTPDTAPRPAGAQQRPAGHAVHTDAAATENDPAAHTPVTTLKPAVAQ